MSLLDSLRYRWRVLTRPKQHEADLADDMEFFVNAEARQQAHAARGTSDAGNAQSAASRRFGNQTYYREEARRVAGLAFFDVLKQDARFALRTFARTPGFTAIAISTLAIGIGANTALFSAVDTLLLAPLPYREPERLMNITLTVPPTAGNSGANDVRWSYPKAEVFRQNQNVFSDLTVWFNTMSTLRIGDEAHRTLGEFVDQHYFSTLGIVPARGRGFLPTENRVDGAAVVVISDDLWRSAFNADPSVIGQKMGVDLAMFTIVGVAPPGFGGVSGTARFWVPFLSSPPVWDAGYFPDPYQHTFHLIGRLAPGVTPERAAAVTRAVGPRVDAQYPERGTLRRQWGATAETLDGTRLDDVHRKTLFLLFGAVGLVLLVACANVANLLLVRAASRHREIAVRLAIGASRARIVRQLLVESLLLSVAGGVGGIAIAAVGVKIISFARPALWGNQSASGVGTVLVDPIHLNLATFAFAGAIAIVTGLLFGLAPALQSTRPNLTEALKTDAATAVRSTGAGARRISLRDVLPTFQIAIAVVLLGASGVLVRSLVNLVGVRTGFDAEGVLTMRVNRAAAWSRDSISRFYDVAIDRLHSVPGVAQVAMSDCAPQAGGCEGRPITILDHDSGPRDAGAGLRWITAEWNDVMRVPLLRGRALATTDRRGTFPVALVSEHAAREFWPNDDAIGKRLAIQGRDTVTVVGVVGDVRYLGLHDPPRSDVYISYYQFPMSFRMMFLLRTNRDPAALTESVRRAIREVAPGFPIYDVATLEVRIGNALGQARFLAQLLSVFAMLALILATIGTYGVISYTVARRTREMGIRLALGATERDLVRLVVGQGVVFAAVGGALGLAGAFAAVRVLRAQLYGVEATDPITLAGVLVLLLLVVLAASWIPARRATAVPAVDALRSS